VLMQRLNLNIPQKELKRKFYAVLPAPFSSPLLPPLPARHVSWCLSSQQADMDAKKSAGYHKLDFQEFTAFFKVPPDPQLVPHPHPPPLASSRVFRLRRSRYRRSRHDQRLGTSWTNMASVRLRATAWLTPPISSTTRSSLPPICVAFSSTNRSVFYSSQKIFPDGVENGGHYRARLPRHDHRVRTRRRAPSS
jgi:hypothetical protein